MLTLEVLGRENSSKLDMVLMNIGRLMRAVRPNENRISIPHGMPSIPLGTEEDLRKFENFLAHSDVNLSAVVSIISLSLVMSLSSFFLCVANV